MKIKNTITKSGEIEVLNFMCTTAISYFYSVPIVNYVIAP